MHEIQLYLQYRSGDLKAGNIVCSDLKNGEEIFFFHEWKKIQPVNSHLLLIFVNLFIEKSFFFSITELYVGLHVFYFFHHILLLFLQSPTMQCQQGHWSQ